MTLRGGGGAALRRVGRDAAVGCVEDVGISRVLRGNRSREMPAHLAAFWFVECYAVK